MENEILLLIIKLIKNDIINEAYKNHKKKISFPSKYSNSLNSKIIIDFTNNYFDRYKEALFLNAIIYAIRNYNKRYLFLLENNKINYLLENNDEFRIKTTEFALKNIINNIDYNNLSFNSKNNERIISKHKDYINNFTIYLTKPKFINEVYRNLIFKFLDKRKERIKTLDVFLTTNIYDVDFIKSNNYIKLKDINSFKRYIIRLILSDNYLITQSYLEEDKIDSYIKEIDETYDFSDIEEDDKKILDFINECIDNKKFLLPSNYNIRYNMLENFIDYNIENQSKEYEISQIEENEENVKRLKLINPLYKLDLLQN